MRASEYYIILHLLIIRVHFPSFSEPRIYSIMYISTILTSRSPRAFARVPILTRVNDRDTFISTSIDRVHEVYERAVSQVPPGGEKRHWRRYIVLWLDYAFFEEIETKVRFIKRVS
jgi:hypothetical protein